MTKNELTTRLMAGECLSSILKIVDGQECPIFKAEDFTTGDDIVYIPDLWLHDIPADKDLSADREETERLVSYCYTGKDFVELCNGNEELAERLFHYCDWQHPTTAIDEEICDELGGEENEE